MTRTYITTQMRDVVKIEGSGAGTRGLTVAGATDWSMPVSIEIIGAPGAACDRATAHLTVAQAIQMRSALDAAIALGGGPGA